MLRQLYELGPLFALAGYGSENKKSCSLLYYYEAVTGG